MFQFLIDWPDLCPQKNSSLYQLSGTNSDSNTVILTNDGWNQQLFNNWIIGAKTFLFPRPAPVPIPVSGGMPQILAGATEPEPRPGATELPSDGLTPGRGVRAGERVVVTTRGDSYQEVKQFLILFRAMLCRQTTAISRWSSICFSNTKESSPRTINIIIMLLAL